MYWQQLWNERNFFSRDVEMNNKVCFIIMYYNVCSRPELSPRPLPAVDLDSTLMGDRTATVSLRTLNTIQ